MANEKYWGSVLFFKHLILAVMITLIVVPTIGCIVLLFRCRSLEKELQSIQEQISSLQEPETRTAAAMTWTEGLSYQELYPDLYVDRPLGPELYESKTIYLTFDDGPSLECTAQILDILKEYDIKATFFVVGMNNATPEKTALLKRIAEEGHTLGIHSYCHDYNKIYSSTEAFLDDFYQVYQWVYESTGVKPEVFRFPGGSVNEYNMAICREIITEMNRRGFRYYDWNMAANDAVSGGISADRIVDNILDQSRNVVRGVVLMHDSHDKATTVEALPEIITGLQEQGFAFAPLTREVTPVTFKYIN